MRITTKPHNIYMRQKLIEVQGVKHASPITVVDFNIPPIEMGRPSRHKFSKYIVELNSIINQLIIIDIYRLLYPTRAEFIFFST